MRRLRATSCNPRRDHDFECTVDPASELASGLGATMAERAYLGRR